MATTEESTQRLKESKPPATDAATYLTIIDMSLTPEILPALEEILDDVEVTSEIGWDLVDMLIPVPGSQGCLDRVARLGNPREVILKVLEAMEKTYTAGEVDDDLEGTSEKHKQAVKQFVCLCGMLGVLHKRLRVKAPSRFLQTTLDTVYRTYDPKSADATAAVIALLRSLSGQKRPPLPTRTSSMQVGTPSSAAGESAPDPEAEKTDTPGVNEPALVSRMLMCFVTCVIEAYVNSNALEWAARLLEYTYPEKIVMGRKSAMQLFRETEELKTKDDLIGQLVSLADDLGLSKLDPAEITTLIEGPVNRDPLLEELESDRPEDIKLSTGGYLCLVAYWMFSSDIFDAQHNIPNAYIFPHHHEILRQFLGEDVQDQISNNPGTLEAITTIGVWLNDKDRLTNKSASDAPSPDYMSYHHLLTLISVFHPNLRVRNAATVLAGQILHTAPEDERLAILEDLLENCMFSSLQAAAVTWLKEEIISAKKSESSSKFASPDCLEALQYTVYPDLTSLRNNDIDALLEFWAEGSPFYLQAANFAMFLFSGDLYRGLAPVGMAATIEHRYVEPLLAAAKTMTDALEKKEVAVEGHGEVLMQLDILKDRLGRIQLQ